MAKIIEENTGTELISLGDLSPIDWVANKFGRVVGYIELKTRHHTSDKYPTVFLNVRKWLALMLTEIGTGTPSLFVVRFTDKLMKINVSDIDARNMRMGGCKKRVKSENDIEPVIEVPIEDMKVLKDF